MSDSEPTDDDAPALPKRGKALGCGIGCGLLGTAVFAGLGWFIATVVTHGGEDSVREWLTAAGVVATLVGLLLLLSASRDDAAHHRRESSPQLPLDLAEEGAPVWISGVVVCPRAAVAPRFGVPCAWLRFEVTKKVGKRTEALGKGDRAPRTWIEDAEGRAELDYSSVSFEQLLSWSEQQGNLTTTATFLAAGDRATAWGVLRGERRPPPPAAAQPTSPRARPKPEESREDVLFESAKQAADTIARETAAAELPEGLEIPPQDDPTTGAASEDALVLRGLPDLPLLVTPLTRRAWIEHVETDESWTRTMGAVFLLAGGAVAAAAAAPWTAIDDGEAPLALAAVAVIASLLACASLRRVRACRERAEESGAALERELARSTERDTAAAVRVAARLRVYDQMAAEHNDALAHFPASWIGRLVGHRPLPLRGADDD